METEPEQEKTTKGKTSEELEQEIIDKILLKDNLAAQIQDLILIL